MKKITHYIRERDIPKLKEALIKWRNSGIYLFPFPMNFKILKEKK